MPAALVDSDAFAFADGGSGHVCDLGSAPTVGQWDVLAVNSDTVVSTPSGWSLLEQAVNNQGSYFFGREAAGGEGSTVTVTTSGNHNTQVTWSRWDDVDALDTSTSTLLDNDLAGSSPSHNTGALAATGELVIVLSANHSIGLADQASPAWSSGYTGLAMTTQGTGATGVVGIVGYKIGAGTAAETPSVSWSGDGARNRYVLVVTFTATANQTVHGAGTATLGGLAATGAGQRTVHGAAAGVLGPLAATGTGRRTVHGLAAGALGGLATSGSGRRMVHGAASAALGRLTATGVVSGQRPLVTRPNTGLVVRPDTGLVTRP